MVCVIVLQMEFFFGKYTQVRELMVMLFVVKSYCLYFVAEGESVGGWGVARGRISLWRADDLWIFMAERCDNYPDGVVSKETVKPCVFKAIHFEAHQNNMVFMSGLSHLDLNALFIFSLLSDVHRVHPQSFDLNFSKPEIVTRSVVGHHVPDAWGRESEYRH